MSRKASCGRQRAEDKENSGNAFLLMKRGQSSSLRRWVGSAPIYIYIHATVNAKTMWFHHTMALATEMDPEKHPHKWESPNDFPEIVGTWFGRQREILFRGMSIYGAADIMIVYQRLCATTKGPLKENPSLAEMIYGLIKEQAKMIGNLPTSSTDDLIYCGFTPFDVVEVICFGCRKPLPPDTKAMWSVMRLGHYVPRPRRCHIDLCQGKLRGAVPKDPSIPFVWHHPKLRSAGFGSPTALLN